MKIVKIVPLFLTIFSLIIASCDSNSFSNSSFSVSSSELSSILQPSESSSSSMEQAKNELMPISDDLLSFYKSRFNSEIGEPYLGPGIAGLYRLYKEDKEQLIKRLEYKCVYNLTLEGPYHCYYLHKNAYDELLTAHTPGCEFNFFLNRAYSGLVDFISGINGRVFSEETMNQPIMELIIDSEKETIPIKIHDYYLLDVVRYYRFDNQKIYGEFNPNYEPRIAIDFMTFERTSEMAIINKKETKDRYRFFNCFYAKPKEYFNYNCKYKYDFFAVISWFCQEEITIEDGVDVVKTKLEYYKDCEPTYYDDLEACIISKSFLESGNEFDSYSVTYDFSKIDKLFSI